MLSVGLLLAGLAIPTDPLVARRISLAGLSVLAGRRGFFRADGVQKSHGRQCFRVVATWPRFRVLASAFWLAGVAFLGIFRADESRGVATLSMASHMDAFGPEARTLCGWQSRSTPRWKTSATRRQSKLGCSRKSVAAAVILAFVNHQIVL